MPPFSPLYLSIVLAAMLMSLTVVSTTVFPPLAGSFGVASVRPEVLSAADASNTFKLRDLPEVRAEDGTVTFASVTMKVVVRQKLSKVRRRDIKFLPAEGCRLLEVDSLSGHFGTASLTNENQAAVYISPLAHARRCEDEVVSSKTDFGMSHGPGLGVMHEVLELRCLLRRPELPDVRV